MKPPIADAQNFPTEILVLPAEKVYWSFLDVPQGYRLKPGPLPPGLQPHLQDDLPIPIEGLHTVCAPCSIDRLLVCAVARHELESRSGDALLAFPASVPATLEVDSPREDFNFLVGEFEPPAISLARSRRYRWFLATVIVSTTLASIGLLRHAQHNHTRAQQAQSSVRAILNAHTLDQRDASLFALRDHVRSVRELVAAAQNNRDAVDALEALLHVWPVEVACKPQAVTVSPEGISVAVVVEGDASSLLAKIAAPMGFTMDEPRLAAGATSTRVNLLFRQTPGGTR